MAPFTSEAVEVIGKIDLYFQLRGDLPQIERMARHVVERTERWRPSSKGLSLAEASLVDILIQRGKLEEAGQMSMRAAKHSNDYAARRSAAGLRPFREGRSAKSVADVALAKGDLASAERWYSESLKEQPNSDAVSGLADVYESRGEEAQAEDLLLRLVPPGRTHNGMVPILSRLAEMELSRGNLSAAESLLQRAIEYAQRVMAGSLPHVEALRVSGAVAMHRGDQPTAMARYAEALAAIEKKGSGTMAHAEVLQAQADLFRERGDLPAAEERYRRAVDVRMRLAPQTTRRLYPGTASR